MAQEPGGRPEQSERPIPHDRSFLDVARVKLDGQEYVRGRGYRLHPGSDLYRTFVTFLAEELERLPFDGAMGEAIPMRGDAREVVARLAAYLRDQAAHAAPGIPWDRDRNAAIADIFRGWLEVFKNEIYAGTGQSGMCCSLDLGAQHVR
ncbi:MAG: hypothetical protein Q8R16_02725 [bacterium]|nr:hypothetical protein [bacterium]